MNVLHECLDNDSPWLICKHCGAVGRCEMEATSDSPPTRESVVDALLIVGTYGPWGADLNDAHRRQVVLADEVLRLQGEQAVLVRLLIEADKVMSTLEGENTDEQELLDNLRRQITIATIPHRPEEADLLSLRACIGA